MALSHVTSFGVKENSVYYDFLRKVFINSLFSLSYFSLKVFDILKKICNKKVSTRLW